MYTIISMLKVHKQMQDWYGVLPSVLLSYIEKLVNCGPSSAKATLIFPHTPFRLWNPIKYRIVSYMRLAARIYLCSQTLLSNVSAPMLRSGTGFSFSLIFSRSWKYVFLICLLASFLFLIVSFASKISLSGFFLLTLLFTGLVKPWFSSPSPHFT